mgnify:CR=1 FL=1
MVESSRLYRRKSVSIPVMFLPDEFPIVASHTEALPMTPFGTIARESFGASTKNTSAEGLCLVTEKKLEPGTEIEVRMVDFKPIPMGSESMAQCQAKVVWCIPVGQTAMGKCYEVGARKTCQSDLPILNLGSRHFASLKCM